MRHVLPLAGLVGVFCLAFFGEQGLMANHQLRVEMGELEQEIEGLRSTNAELEEQIRRLQQDPSSIESAIREEMMMVREGEVVYTFQDEETNTPAPPEGEVDGTGDR